MNLLQAPYDLNPLIVNVDKPDWLDDVQFLIRDDLEYDSECRQCFPALLAELKTLFLRPPGDLKKGLTP